MCRFLQELHHRGKFPEDRFCWLVDQVLYRFAEARLQSQPAVAVLILQDILGEMPKAGLGKGEGEEATLAIIAFDVGCIRCLL